MKSAKKLNLSDKMLVQRFLPIPAVSALYLVAWTAIGRPLAEWKKTNAELKFKYCMLEYWDIGALIGNTVAFISFLYLFLQKSLRILIHFPKYEFGQKLKCDKFFFNYIFISQSIRGEKQKLCLLKSVQ